MYAGRSPTDGGQTAGSAAIIDVLTRAGLHGEPDVRPGSVAVWAARRSFDRTGRIEDAATALGVRSLDGAARLIGWTWQSDADS